MWLKRLTLIALIVACLVVALGAYTRLKDAGLGCPDWPGCYGNIVVPKSDHAIAQANQAYPHRPVETEKAWAEMIHRYFASALGLLIFGILGLSIRERRRSSTRDAPPPPLKLPILLSALVVFQGILGMWTVTLGLFPTVVMAHLLGGFTTLCLLFFLALRLYWPPSPASPSPLFKWGLLAMVILTVQIALGGWTSANYSATVCTELPICQAGWQQHINWSDGFKFWGHGHDDYEYATHLGPDAKITIHVAHRVGAIITTLYLGTLFLVALFSSSTSPVSRRVAAAALLILGAQVGLGISNIVFQLPLAVAVAHNGVAAILMMSLIFLNASLFWSGAKHHDKSYQQSKSTLSAI